VAGDHDAIVYDATASEKSLGIRKDSVVSPTPVKISFGPFMLDSGRRRLSRKDREIPLSRKAFDLLVVLLERRPNVVDKDTLLATIWPDATVIEANLNVLISEIRAALSDNPRRARFIQTIHGIGFAFCGEASNVDARSAHLPPSAGPSRYWLVWNERTFMLSEGDNLIGRDPKSHVWLDGSGVSRRHASIRVDVQAQQAVLEDLGSTNGTFVQESRVETAVTLADGDLIKVGSIELKFRVWLEAKSHPTERIRRRSHSSE